jgi:hypothetical protein
LLEYELGIALSIAALALFVGLRVWSTKLDAGVVAEGLGALDDLGTSGDLVGGPCLVAGEFGLKGFYD